jgi:hypothetical protein
MAVLEYLDFDLLVEQLGGNRYRVRVLNSPAGQASGLVQLPFSELELENFLLRIGRPRRGVRRLESPEMEAAKQFGGKLFKAVFDNELLSALRSSLDEANKQERGLRLRLRLNDAPTLVNLPWEYLYNPTLNRFLTLSASTPLVRYLELPERITPLKVKPPLRALVMIANPSDYSSLDVEREWQNLKTALRELERRSLLKLDRLQAATPGALQDQLRRKEYHIFHFIGHGGFHEQAQDGILLLEDEAGRGRPLSGQFLGTLLHDQRSLRLVVLNACEGARSGRTDPFAGVAQSMVQQGIPAVIAMQFEITDEAAIAFGREFYTAVAEGYPVDAGVAEARKAIYAQGNDIEWGTPVLYMRAPDGLIFDISKLEAASTAMDRTMKAEREPTQPVPGKGRDKSQEELRVAYINGLSAYYLLDWEKACEHFQHVVELDANYEDAAAKLQEARQNLILERLYGQAEQAIQENDWQAAVAGLEKIVGQNPGYRDAAAKLSQAHQQYQLSRLYNQAREMHQAGQWQAVVNVFAHIQALQRDYPDPHELLKGAREKIAESERQAELEGLHSQALLAMKAQEWQQAASLLAQVLAIQADYGEAGRLASVVQSEIERAKAEQQRQARLAGLEAGYAEARTLAGQGRWQQVLGKIEAILVEEPAFGDRDNLANLAREALAEGKRRAEEQAGLENEQRMAEIARHEQARMAVVEEAVTGVAIQPAPGTTLGMGDIVAPRKITLPGLLQAIAAKKYGRLALLAAGVIVIGLLGGLLYAALRPEPPILAFASDRDGDWEIYTMHADGSSLKQWTSNEAFDCCPSWAPDGKRIAFVSDRNQDSQIFILDIVDRTIYALEHKPYDEYDVRWSPASEKLIYTTERAGLRDVGIVNADGTVRDRLFYNPGSDYAAAWSPDGKSIVFLSDRSGVDRVYYYGMEINQLAQIDAERPGQAEPCFTPDGNWVTYLALDEAGSEAFFMASLGELMAGKARPVSYQGDYEGRCWEGYSPDQQYLAYTFLSGENNLDIYVKNLVSGKLTRTTNPTNDDYPSWQPAP